MRFLMWTGTRLCGQLCRALQLSPCLQRTVWGPSFATVLPRNMPSEQLPTVTLGFAADSEEVFTALSRY
ncbi:hypothetical protein K443DRAFT_322097 [Laccaria amethystina LaAM-08-1]|uniref:Uncharacterized protein n=1 Tax=Laccaria amethystina LaAM-08-1 TaxID=1095629 RepID=A0A0C9XD42_9AGAR|nr:hypothetical protein K443DRAFT_322097 [Laccaria amethystina LaAM-08-1]